MKTREEIEDEEDRQDMLDNRERHDDYQAACWEAAHELERHRARGWTIH